jgi:hypothetical protein
MEDKRFNIKLNDKVNLQTGLNELLHETERLIKQIQDQIDNIANSTSLSSATLDEKAEYGKIIHNFIVDKTNGLKLKLDIQKLATEVLKFGGDENGALMSLNKAKAFSGTAFNPAEIQKMIKEQEQPSEPSPVVYKIKK